MEVSTWEVLLYIYVCVLEVCAVPGLAWGPYLARHVGQAGQANMRKFFSTDRAGIREVYFQTGWAGEREKYFQAGRASKREMSFQWPARAELQ